MKVAILAGGRGSRLVEQTEVKPKPMVEIGGRPILWHIMKMYEHTGFDEFVVALGYKGSVIKRYFLDYLTMSGHMSINLAEGKVDRHEQQTERWQVHLIDTGQETQTGGRLRRLQPWLGDQTFLLTYGDGVADIDIPTLIRYHREQGRMVTVTAVRPPARFGELTFRGDLVSTFAEKSQISEGWINGGFMVCEPAIFDFLVSDGTVLESDALRRLAEIGQLAAYRHSGFWQCMDTLRDVHLLGELWNQGGAPWKVWR